MKIKTTKKRCMRAVRGSFTVHSSIVAVVAAVATFPAAMRADTLADWTFETSPPVTAGPFTADSGIYAANSSALGNHASASTVYSSPVGNGSNHSFSSTRWAVNDYYQFKTSTTGYYNIFISFDQTASATGPENFDLQYSLNGSSFVDTGDTYVVITNPTTNGWNNTTPLSGFTYALPLSAISALANQSTVYFRLVDTSTTSTNGGVVSTAGTNRVDNVVIQGTAIPTTLLWAGGNSTWNTSLVQWTNTVANNATTWSNSLFASTTANFNTVNTIAIDSGGITAASLNFQSGSNGIVLNGPGTLTLSSGKISLDPSVTASISGNLAIPNGLTIAGGGILFLDTITPKNTSWQSNLTVTNGTLTDGDHDLLAPGTGNTVNALVTGSASRWNVGFGLDIASLGGTAHVTVSAGGVVFVNGGSRVAVDTGSNASLTVTGSGSTFSVTQRLSIAGNGTGTLALDSGGIARSFGGDVGTTNNGFGSGTATLSGTGTSWDASGDFFTIGGGGGATGNVMVSAGAKLTTNLLVVGQNGGTGTLTISSGGSENTDSFSVGIGVSATGTGMITDSGTNVISTGALTVGGDGGTGQFTVQSGAHVTTGGLNIGEGNPASNGTMTVTGMGSSLTKSVFGVGDSNIGDGTGNKGALVIANSAVVSLGQENFFIGRAGNGTVQISGGGNLAITGGNSFIGSNDIGTSSTGLAVVSGAGSSWSTAGQLTVGDTGVGSVTVNTGGTLSATLDSTIGNAAGSNGQVSVSDASSVATFSGNLSIGTLGTGTLTATNSAKVTVANTLTVGGTLNADGSGNGTLTVSAGGQVTAATVDVADGMTPASMSSGTILITGANSVFRAETMNLAATANASGSASIHVTNSATLTDLDGQGSINIGIGFSSNQKPSGTESITVDNSATLRIGQKFINGFNIVPEGTQTAALIVDGPATVVDASVYCQPGVNATSSVIIRNGAQIDGGSGGFYLSADGSQGATMTIQDAGTTATSTGVFVLSVGQLTVTNSATLFTGTMGSLVGSAADIGYSNGGNVLANATVSNSARWIAAGQLVVGFGIPSGNNGDSRGDGELDIATGGSVQAVNAYLGRFDQGHGTISINGQGSSLTLSGSLYVGGIETPINASSGIVTVANGGTLYVATDSTIGNPASSSGQVTISDAGSNGTFGGSLRVGAFGSGILTVANLGKLAVTKTLTVGGISSADGSGNGTFNITGGGQVAVDTVVVADGNSTGNNSSGVVLVSGVGSTLQTQTLSIGNGPSFSTASMHIASGGKVSAPVVSVGASLDSVNSDAGIATLTVDSGGQLLTSDLVVLITGNGQSTFVGDGAHTLITGGIAFLVGNGAATATFSNGAHLDATNSTSFITLSRDATTSPLPKLTFTDPSTLATGPNEILINAGLITIANGASVSSGSMNSPSGSAGAIGDGYYPGGGQGEVIVMGADSHWNANGHISIGLGFGTADSGQLIVQAGGAVNCINAYLGRAGAATGTVTVTGAGSLLHLSGSLYLAGNESSVSTGCTGTLTLADSGSIIVAGSENIGQDGVATVTQTGGSNSVTGSVILAVDAGAAGTYSLKGGSLGTNGITVNSGGTFTQTSGTVTVASILTQSGGTMSLGGSQTFYSIPTITLTGGTTTFTTDAKKILVASSLTITSPAQLDLTTNDLLVHSTVANLSSDDTKLQIYLNAGEIRSSFATAATGLALMEGSDYLLLQGSSATFAGQPVTTSDLLIRYTYLGDANFDGQITIDDYLQIDSGFLTGGFNGTTKIAQWVNGDFDGNGVVNALDYALIDYAYFHQSGTLASGMIDAHVAEFGEQYTDAFNALLAPSVPEPSSLAFLGLGAATILKRRRKMCMDDVKVYLMIGASRNAFERIFARVCSN